MLNVALVGAGSIGQIHAGNIAGNARCRLAAICDADTERAKALASRHDTQPAALENCLAADIDAVIIASSTTSHGDVAAACLEAGKPFLCEKPLAGDLSEGLRLAIEAAVADFELPLESLSASLGIAGIEALIPALDRLARDRHLGGGVAGAA